MAVKTASPFLWYDKRPVRERAMLLGCTIIILLFLVKLLLLQPLEQKNKQALLKLNVVKTDLAQLMILEHEMLARKDKDPNRDNRKRLQTLQQETITLQNQLEASIVSLVSPVEMPGLLKELLTQQDALSLISLENMAPEQIHFAEQKSGEDILPVLYRHSLRMTFGGDYLTLLQYLNQLEDLPRTVVWEEVDIETGEYPEATVRLQVYTLSLLEGWIGG